MWTVLVLFTVVYTQDVVPQNCTLSQSQWNQFFSATLLEDPVPPVTLCGVTLPTLMRVDAARLLQPQNALWLAASHTYATAVLNAWTASAVCDLNALDVNRAILLLGDSLTRTCDKPHCVDTGAVAGKLAHALLLRFNEGSSARVHCVSGPATQRATAPVPAASPLEPFYYYQEPGHCDAATAGQQRHTDVLAAEGSLEHHTGSQRAV